MQFAKIRTIPLQGFVLALTCLLLAVGSANAQEADPYTDRLQQQLDKIEVTDSQVDAFREVLAEFYSRRNGALRRIGRQGGDLKVRVRRDLKREANKSVEAMEAILSEQQLAEYRLLVEMACEQYMARAGLI